MNAQAVGSAAERHFGRASGTCPRPTMALDGGGGRPVFARTLILLSLAGALMACTEAVPTGKQAPDAMSPADVELYRAEHKGRPPPRPTGTVR